MAQIASNLKNRSYLQNSVAILLFFASWGIWWSFFQLWLTKPAAEGGLGFDGGQVGTIYAINSAATLVIMFFYGTMQDRLGTKRHLAILLGVIATCIGPFANFVYRPSLSPTSGSVPSSVRSSSPPGLWQARASWKPLQNA